MGPSWNSGGFGIARTRSSDRNWNVSFGSNLSTRRVKFLDLEEPPDIDGAALIHIVSIDVSEARGSQVQPRARDHSVLNRHVIKMLLFEVGGGLDLDQTPSAVSTAMQDVHSYKHTAVLESRLEDRRDLGICDQLAGGANRLLRIAERDFHAAREKLACELPTCRPCSMIATAAASGTPPSSGSCTCQYKSLEALTARYEFRLGNVHVAVVIPAESAPQTPERPVIPLS